MRSLEAMNPGPVWIDLANSPHVLLFQPILAELERRGVPALVTARDFAQTIQLCRVLGVSATIVGGHDGGAVLSKARGLATRVHALRRFAQRERPSVAVSHNSYAQAVAGRSLGIPVLTAMDYEHQPANHLAFRCATLVAVPETFPREQLHRQGARPGKTWRYPGLKEEIALAGFEADPDYLQSHGIDATKVVVVVRPPADTALYHRFENPLFAELLRRLQGDADLAVVTLPRTPEQTLSLTEAGFGDLLWAGETLDGRQLIAGADAVISAGGSMNREAAVLGTPAYSVFAGAMAAVDRYLVTEGRLHMLDSSNDISALALRKKPSLPARRFDDALLRRFVDKVLEVAHR